MTEKEAGVGPFKKYSVFPCSLAGRYDVIVC